MKHIYFLMTAIVAIMAVSCMDEISAPVSEKNDDLVEMAFTSSFEGATKTVLDGLNVNWLPGDEIAVNGERFTTDIKNESPIAVFSGQAAESQGYDAVYPYESVESYDGRNYRVKLPEVQKAYKGTFADDLNISAAFAWNAELPFIFSNLLGYVKFSIDASLDNIKSVTVRSNSAWTRVWATAAEVNPYNKMIHIYDSYYEKLSVKLEADEVLEKGDYYIALLPNTFIEGLSFDFEREDGYVGTLTIKREIELCAGEIKNIGLVRNLDFKPSVEMQKAAEKDALISLYNSTGGDAWTNNENWCSDLPVSEWYGVYLDLDGYVEGIDLRNNNLTGEFPDEISAFTRIQRIILPWNNLTGNLPDAIGDLKQLSYMDLGQNQLTGEIPDVFGDLPIRMLDLSRNNLTGTIPESISGILNENLYRIYLNHNMLSGTVPETVLDNEYFSDHWVNMLYQDGYNYILDVSGAKIKAPVFETADIDGSVIDSADIYKDNEYTVLFNWGIGCGFSMAFIPVLKAWYEEYKDCGVDVIAYSADSLSDVESIVESNGLIWNNFKLDQGSDLYSENIYLSSAPLSPFVAVVDRHGYIIHNPINDDREKIIELFEAKWGDLDGGMDDMYESVDFTQDGTVKTLQTASEGNGINIVIMGDGYSDRQIADGAYDIDIANAWTAMFSVEPYKKFSNLFNVYSVTAVSKNEGFAGGNDTIFEGWLSDAGSDVGGNNQKVLEYALKAVSETEMDETLVIVVMNDLRYGGTCYMYHNTDSVNDWGSGTSIAYLPLSSSSAGDTFAQVLNHEAGGHGFAKLVDEYYNGRARITSEEIEGYQAMETYGFYKNGDFTDSIEDVKWAHFLADDRYSDEGLGVFEGGFAYYAYGVYRPTWNSIMNDNTGGFNAPSREAIYYRIHKLAYGSTWEYDYEEFVRYDEINRVSKASSAKRCRNTNYVERGSAPLAPPVVIYGSWKD